MTYFNPKIYNKNNLKEKERRELDYWESEFLNVIEGTKFEFDIQNCDEVPSIATMKKEIVEQFCEELKTRLGYQLQDNVVSIITNYDEDEDVEEVENPDTYFYVPKDDEEDE